MRNTYKRRFVLNVIKRSFINIDEMITSWVDKM